MDGSLKRKLFAEIDEYVSHVKTNDTDFRIAEIIKPELERLSKENNIDIIDLFVAYMDHVTKNR